MIKSKRINSFFKEEGLW